MEPVIFNFNNYIEQNPVAQFCVEKYPEKTILTEKDLHDEIMSLKHSKWAYENGQWGFVGDELRLYLSTISDDFIYIDGDSWVRDLNRLKMNCCCLEQDGHKNDGSFFRANKNTKWTKHYLDVYENNDIGATVNYEVHEKFPTNIQTQRLDYTHYYTSFFRRLKQRHPGTTLCYTLFADRAQKEIMAGRDVLWLQTQIQDIYYTAFKSTLYKYLFLPMDVLENQFKSIGIKLINLDA